MGFVMSLEHSPARQANYQITRPLRYTVKAAAEALGCSQLFIYELIHKGLLRAQGSKRKLWIPALSLDAYVESQPDYVPE
jgi:excisionase family DNA binding protein